MTEELKSIIRHLDYATQEDEDKAIGYLRRLMPQWTTEKPKEPGWYWWRLENGYEPEMAHLQLRNGRLRDISYGAITDIPNTGQWAGPIPEPQEA